MSPGATPAHIAPMWTGGPGITPMVPGTNQYAAVPVVGFPNPPPTGRPPGPLPPNSECWICPPYGSGQSPSQAAPSICAAYQANPSLFPPGYTPTLVPAGSGPPCNRSGAPLPPVQVLPPSGPPAPTFYYGANPAYTGPAANQSSGGVTIYGGIQPQPPGPPPILGTPPVPRGQGYGALPPAVVPPQPNVTINGQPMICCPCTT